MQPQDFLAAVLPSTGVYCAADVFSTRPKHVFTDSIEHVINTCNGFTDKRLNAYFALASFDDSKQRKAANALYMRDIFIDLDIGDGVKTYLSKKEAAAALVAFTKETGLDTLGAPWLIDSGGGIHAHWPLNADATIEEWEPVAQAFKDRAKDLGFRIDRTVTADAARVLRTPGTMNFKYDPPRPVALKFAGDIFSLKEIAEKLNKGVVKKAPPTQALTLAIPGKPLVGASAPLSETAKSLMQNSTTLFKNIMVKTVAGEGCGQIANYVDNAKDDGLEPLWRGLLSLTKKCEDGDKASRKLSAMHPYDTERMEKKLADIKGPYSCVTLDDINPGICGECKHWGKITNPLALGRQVLTETEPKDYTEVSEIPGLPQHAGHLIRPIPPRPFSFGRNGGLYFHLKDKDVDKEIMLLPFDFFLVDVLQESAVYTARFAAIRKNTTTFVVIPNKAAGSKDEVIKALASQNIIASFGSGSDKYLYDYVRACMSEAAATDSALRVPPSMGWQEDGNFAVGETMLKEGLPSYTYVSGRLGNLMTSMRPQGTVGEWQRVIHMLQAKGQSGIVAMGLVGFASPLMQWLDAGTPGMVFHVCGKSSGAGKSLSMLLAASVWGNPATFPVKANTSETTMLQRAGFLGNLPLLVDEVTTNSRKTGNEWIPGYVFAYSQGGHKLKGSGSSSSELENNLFWNALSMITSNDPCMEAMMGARDTTSEGEARRMLEWHTTERVEWTDAERALIPLLSENRGVAGLQFAKWLVNNRETAKQVVIDTMGKWRKMVDAKDHERFWSSGCVALLAAAQLVGPTYANVCTVHVKPVALFLRGLVTSARSIIDANQLCAEDILHAYSREYNGQFVKYSEDQRGIAIFSDGRMIARDSTRGRVAGRVDTNVRTGWTETYIEEAVMKRYCATRNWSYLEFVRQLGLVLPVEPCRRDLLANTGGASMRVACIKISRQISADPE